MLQPPQRGPGVAISEPERMNLLGLLLASLLERRLTEPGAARHARALRGTVSLDAGGMQVTLAFEPGRITLSRGQREDSRAAIRGTLKAFLEAALGRNRVRNFVHGALRVRGNPFVLWHVLVLLRS